MLLWKIKELQNAAKKLPYSIPPKCQKIINLALCGFPLNAQDLITTVDGWDEI